MLPFCILALQAVNALDAYLHHHTSIFYDRLYVCPPNYVGAAKFVVNVKVGFFFVINMNMTVHGMPNI